MEIKKMLISVLSVLFIGYLFLVCLAYFRQDSMLFYPLREIEATPADIGLEYADVELLTSDGTVLSAWYVPAESPRGAVLFCHGNAGNISHRLDSLRIFHRLNLAVLIFDYRGYGRSEGTPSEDGMYLDAEAALRYLLSEKHVRPAQIIVFGRSLGSAVAAETALRNKVGGLIVESGFTSVPDLGSKYFPYLPVKYISRYRYSTAEKIGSITAPKLFVHSPDDELIPFEHGRSLYEKALPPKEFLIIRGGHNDGFLLSGDAYIQGLDQFVKKYIGVPAE